MNTGGATYRGRRIGHLVQRDGDPEAGRQESRRRVQDYFGFMS